MQRENYGMYCSAAGVCQRYLARIAADVEIENSAVLNMLISALCLNSPSLREAGVTDGISALVVNGLVTVFPPIPIAADEKANPRQAALMDNASFHKVSAMVEAIDKLDASCRSRLP
ncbi:hypothetical protein [Rubidibacter lacunae]|uniref:hypothetical protein n=1 Tax=Rubidibacter lacunae TaxID=582514 RepID=UPI0003F78096|nr:hypothetical protein [Rubidibacter lacunae]